MFVKRISRSHQPDTLMPFFNVVDTLQSVNTHITEVQCPTTTADIITCLHEPNSNPNPKTIVVDMGPWDKQG